MSDSRKDSRGRVLRKGEGQRKDGRYYYNYLDSQGKRIFIYAADLQKLREKERQLLRDFDDNIDGHTANKTELNVVFDRYIHTKIELKPSTYNHYLFIYDKYVRHGFGKKMIGKIKYSDVLYFYLSLSQDKHLSLNTIAGFHHILHPTFQLAVRDGLLRQNPSDGVFSDLTRKKTDCSKKRHALTIEQQRAFMNFIKDSPKFARWYPLFAVLLGTGCRIGEVSALRWDDINFDKKLVHVRHNVSYYAEKLETGGVHFKWSLTSPKTRASIRVIPMTNTVYDVFLQEHHRQEKEGFSSLVFEGLSGFIFVSTRGKLFSAPCVDEIIERITEVYNKEEIIHAKDENREVVLLPHFSCHTFRHTFCTRLCENDVNIKVIQEIMGHSDIQTTMNIYAEVSESKKIDAFKKAIENIDIF